MSKTHYKKLSNPDYMGAYSLYDNEGNWKEMIVTLTSVEVKEVKGEGGKSEMCTVANVRGQKAIILNATNQKALIKLSDSVFIEDWVGFPVTLFVVKVKVGVNMTEGLRIRDVHPVITLPELTPTSEKWNGAVKALKAKNTTIDAIKKAYQLSPANEKLLTDAAI